MYIEIPLVKGFELCSHYNKKGNSCKKVASFIVVYNSFSNLKINAVCANHQDDFDDLDKKKFIKFKLEEI